METSTLCVKAKPKEPQDPEEAMEPVSLSFCLSVSDIGRRSNLMMSYVCLCEVNRSTLWVFFQGASKKSVETNPTNPNEPQDPTGTMEPASLSVCLPAVADLHSKIMDVPRIQILSMSCSLWEISAKSYASTP